ncbi:MAG: hypothetical protein R3F60_12860 [bacterium]
MPARRSAVAGDRSLSSVSRVVSASREGRGPQADRRDGGQGLAAVDGVEVDAPLGGAAQRRLHQPQRESGGLVDLGRPIEARRRHPGLVGGERHQAQDAGRVQAVAGVALGEGGEVGDGGQAGVAFDDGPHHGADGVEIVGLGDVEGTHDDWL